MEKTIFVVIPNSQVNIVNVNVFCTCTYARLVRIPFGPTFCLTIYSVKYTKGKIISI